MVQLHESVVKRALEPSERSDEEPVSKALAVSALRIARILFRALDYLPPAEATFADYARAVLRSDEVAYPEDETGYRATLKKEFITRGIVSSASELEAAPEVKSVRIDLNNVLESDWAAYAFVEKERRLLKVPPRVPFRLFPRREVTRRYNLGRGRHEDRKEGVIQVTWEEPERNLGIGGVPPRRAVFRGTTLVVGGEPDTPGCYPVLSCLTTSRAVAQARARNELVRGLAERGQLELGDRWETFNLSPLRPKVWGRVAGGLLRLRGTGRLLHLAGPNR
jgi:hypothetical protein